MVKKRKFEVTVVYPETTLYAIMQLTYRLKQFILSLGDFVAFIVGFWFSLFFRFQRLPVWNDIEPLLGPFFMVFLLWIIINYINGLYDLGRHMGSGLFHRRVAEAATISLVASIAFFYLIPNQSIAPKTILLLNIIFGYTLVSVWRALYTTSAGKHTIHDTIIFVGYTNEVADLIGMFERYSNKVYHVAGLIDPDHLAPRHHPDIPLSDNIKDLPRLMKETGARVVVIASHLHADAAALRELYQLLFSQVQIIDLPSFYEVITGRIPPSIFSESWFLKHLRTREQPIYDRVRTITDYLIVGLMGVVCLALFPIIALAIRLNSPGPIFIRQKRIGKFGKIFTLYKFRSMYALSPDGSAETHGVQFATKNDARITPVGRILRKARLDELPQVVNLFRRDLTLIGPRPERPEIAAELESRIPYYPLRHVVPPGLTGWALIHQNYTDNYDTSLEKLQYDLYYIKNRSLLLDTIILLRTVNVIVRFMGQ